MIESLFSEEPPDLFTSFMLTYNITIVNEICSFQCDFSYADDFEFYSFKLRRTWSN